MLENKTAQMVVEPNLNGAVLTPIEILPNQPIEVVDQALPEESLVITDDGNSEPDLIVEVNLDGKLLGAADFDPEKEKELISVVDDSEEDDKDKSEADDSDAKKSKKNEKWDWETKGGKGFLVWVKERIDSVPKHSGYDTAGLERAVSYLERLDDEISKAMRLDLDGELDANQIEHVRSQIEKGLDMLSDRIDAINESKKNKKKKNKKKSDLETTGLVKEAQKITGVQGIYVTVPLLISRVARVCINGMVSAGHDIEDLYKKQVKKYNLNTREQAETMQLLADMGYPLRQDRGYMPEDEIEVTDGMDFAQNFHEWSKTSKE